MATDAVVQEIAIADLQFNPNLAYGYKRRTEPEPNLLDACEKIEWAEHLVWVHPVWLGGLPAQMKGFIDRLFLSGFTFTYGQNPVMWDKLLKARLPISLPRLTSRVGITGWYTAGLV